MLNFPLPIVDYIDKMLTNRILMADKEYLGVNLFRISTKWTIVLSETSKRSKRHILKKIQMQMHHAQITKAFWLPMQAVVRN